MIDDFALVLTHVLIAVACWRMLARVDFDFNIAPTVAPKAATAPDKSPPVEITAAGAMPMQLSAADHRPAVPSLNLGSGRHA